MKILKRVLPVLLVLSVFVGSFVASFALFNEGTYDFDASYLSVFDEMPDRYYLQAAPENIKFRVNTSDSVESLDYSIVDSNNNVITANFEKVESNIYNITPPANGYIAGERYTLTLGPGVSFADENLMNTSILVFCIEREAIEEYVFTDKVRESSTVIRELSDDSISLDGINTQAGEIIFGTNENEEYVAYKISEVHDDGTASVTVPAIDEIYSDLNIYGEYEFDVEDIVTNPDLGIDVIEKLEIDIIENVKNSKFYSSLIATAYADENEVKSKIDVKIKPDKKKNSLEIELKLTLKGGEEGLFGMSELKNHDVVITIVDSTGVKVRANIQGIVDWDISTTTTSQSSYRIDITRNFKKDEIDPALQNLFSENGKANIIETKKMIGEISEQLNEMDKDDSKGEIKLFDWEMPVGSVPGLTFNAEVKLFLEFKLNASLVIGQENTKVYTAGICFTDYKFKPYSNTYRSEDDLSLSLRGKASLKAGIKVEFALVVISKKIAFIEVDPQFGVYADVYVTTPIPDEEGATAANFIYSYFEPGSYFSADITASINAIIDKFEFSHELIEVKHPFEKWKLGNDKIALGIVANADSVRAVNNVVKLPDILLKYYDVKSGINKTETISSDDLKFVSHDGEVLEVERGKLTLPAATPSGNYYVSTTYMHTDDSIYSSVFRILISGSILEGKVSAYTDDLSSGELEGAQVELYNSTGGTTPISTQKTGEDGKFSFTVDEGDYRLVISADGYRTLTSNQSVEKDEIKYTEHILLMDNSQSGIGSAGGRISNALDGNGVEGVSLKLRSNWNKYSGPYFENFTTTTASNGNYSIEGIPVGYYTVEASLNGYVTGYSNISVLSDNSKNDFDFTITPELAADEVRIVLTWGASPYDLDSHLIGRTPDNGSFNVYYSDQQYYFDGVEMANLDVDDTSSYGPETITIIEDIYGTYTYAVHDYSNKALSYSTDLSFSGAVVRVFSGSNQVAEYNVPTDQAGTYWTVFEIDSSGRIMPINTVSNTKPAA